MSEENEDPEVKDEVAESKSDDDGSKRRGSPVKYFFFTVLALIAAGVICFFGFLYLTERKFEMTKDSIKEMFQVFKPNRVQDGFLEWRDLQVTGNDGNILEVATGEETVDLTRESSVEMFGKIVPLVTTTSRIIVPATFRYHIDLKGEWNMIEDGKRLHVIAPKLQPSLPVAFDSAKMQKINPEGWSKYIAGSNMDELEKSITPELEARATDRESIKRFEKEAKDSIAKFLRVWLVGKDQWKVGEVEEIIVYFEGEIVDTQDSRLMPDLRIGADSVLP